MIPTTGACWAPVGRVWGDRTWPLRALMRESATLGGSLPLGGSGGTRRQHPMVRGGRRWAPELGSPIGHHTVIERALAGARSPSLAAIVAVLAARRRAGRAGRGGQRGVLRRHRPRQLRHGQGRPRQLLRRADGHDHRRQPRPPATASTSAPRSSRARPASTRSTGTRRACRTSTPSPASWPPTRPNGTGPAGYEITGHRRPAGGRHAGGHLALHRRVQPDGRRQRPRDRGQLRGDPRRRRPPAPCPRRASPM